MQLLLIWGCTTVPVLHMRCFSDPLLWHYFRRSKYELLTIVESGRRVLIKFTSLYVRWRILVVERNVVLFRSIWALHSEASHWVWNWCRSKSWPTLSTQIFLTSLTFRGVSQPKTSWALQSSWAELHSLIHIITLIDLSWCVLCLLPHRLFACPHLCKLTLFLQNSHWEFLFSLYPILFINSMIVHIFAQYD